MEAKIFELHNSRIVDPNFIPHVNKEGEIGLALEWILSDTKTGKIYLHKYKRGESFTKQFLQIMFIVFSRRSYQSGTALSIKDISNTSRDLYNAWYTPATDIMSAIAASADTAKGIMIGTGNTAPTITDYVMGTLIAHGTGSGQMQYAACTQAAPASDTTTSQMTLTRAFANASGGSITVKEVGIYAKNYCNLVNGAQSFLICRDLIDSGTGIAVPNGQTLTINYKIQAVA